MSEESSPGTETPVSFEAHIKPLFRPRDQKAMRRSFDLDSYADVTAHADAILERLEGGSMPCDGPWPDDQVAVFRRWITAGMPE